MPTFKDAFEHDIYETIGLNRVRTHMGPDREFGQISASRTKDKDGNVLTGAQNYTRHKELKKMVKDAGFGYAKAHGEYQEAGTKALGHERSLLVFKNPTNPNNTEELHSFLMRAGAHFTQDSIIHKPKGAEVPNLHVTTDHQDDQGNWNRVGDNFPIGDFHKNMTGDFGHTALRQGKAKVGKGKTAPTKTTFVFGDKANLKDV